MVLDPFLGRTRQRVLAWVAFAGTLLALFGVHLAAHNVASAQDFGSAYSGLIHADKFSLFMHVVVI